jgi:hypothetical protein
MLSPRFDRLGPARQTRRHGGQEDAMAILTISQEMGSGGAEIGLSVATRLGYTYVDNEELLGRAQRYGLAEDRLARLVEDRSAFRWNYRSSAYPGRLWSLRRRVPYGTTSH